MVNSGVYLLIYCTYLQWYISINIVCIYFNVNQAIYLSANLTVKFTVKQKIQINRLCTKFTYKHLKHTFRIIAEFVHVTVARVQEKHAYDSPHQLLLGQNLCKCLRNSN